MSKDINQPIFSETFRRRLPDDFYDNPTADAIWNVIKTWDIGCPEHYGGYTGAMGNHVQLILDAIVEQRVTKMQNALMEISLRASENGDEWYLQKAMETVIR